MTLLAHTKKSRNTINTFRLKNWGEITRSMDWYPDKTGGGTDTISFRIKLQFKMDSTTKKKILSSSMFLWDVNTCFHVKSKEMQD